jgi:hypothetical protein
MSVTVAAPIVPLQSNGGGGAAALLVPLLSLAFAVVVIAGMWKAFEKAGEPGWAALIPIYNLYKVIEISDNEWWWLILFFLPVINFIALLKINIDLAKTFGQGLGFGLGLAFLSFIFWPLLGFGDYEYTGVPA